MIGLWDRLVWEARDRALGVVHKEAWLGVSGVEDEVDERGQCEGLMWGIDEELEEVLNAMG
jgi:hypothetical protein